MVVERAMRAVAAIDGAVKRERGLPLAQGPAA